MSQSSRSSSSTMCNCGRLAVIVTSWKDDNVGRRFLGCEKYPSDDGHCKFFKWFDPPVCDRAKQIIPRLLRKLNDQKLKNKNLETQIDKLEEVIRIKDSVNCRLKEEQKLLKLKMKNLENGRKQGMLVYSPFPSPLSFG